MAGITEYLNKIKHAIYGKDVRGAIHDAIKQTYDDASKDHDNANMEVSIARGGYNTLNDRLNHADEELSEKASKQELYQGLAPKADQDFVDAQFSSIVSGAPKGTYANLQALKDAYPNGVEGIFLVLADGHWYYWNSDTNEWTDGGVYQGTELQDGSVTTEKLSINYSSHFPYFSSETDDLDYFWESKTVIASGDVKNNPFGTGCEVIAFRGKTLETTDRVWVTQIAVSYGSGNVLGETKIRHVIGYESTNELIDKSPWKPIAIGVITNDMLSDDYAVKAYYSDETYDLDDALEQGNYMVNADVKNNPFKEGSAMSVNKFKTVGSSSNNAWLVQFLTVYGSGPYRGRFAVRVVVYREDTKEISYKSEWSDGRDEPIKILTIGNSFGLNATEYVHNICESVGINVKVGCLYISGGYFEDHYNNIINNTGAYRFYRRYHVDGLITDDYLTDYSVDDALNLEEWDYVFFNQASAQSGVYDTFQPYLTDIIAYVKGKQPNIKVAFMPTWAYYSNFDDTRFDKYDRDQLTMYNAILDAYKEAMSEFDFDVIIPAGTAIQNARTNDYMLNIDDELTRDGYHLGDTGMYIVGLTFFRILMDKYAEVSYIPSTVDKKAGYFGKVATNNAVLNPFKITEI